jgi:trehalose utilization protein
VTPDLLDNSKKLIMTKFLLPLAFVPTLCLASPQDPASTDATGGKFAERTPEKPLRVLLVGAGTSHDFPKFFLGTDARTLQATGSIDVVGTPNLAETLTLLPQADVMVFSGNHPQYGQPEFQKALHAFANQGKGLVILHAANWEHPWPGYNTRFVGGATRGHGKGEFIVTIKDPAHPVMKGVPASFSIIDESYHPTFAQASTVEWLAENAPDKNGKSYPSVWTVKDPKTRIVCITLGHAAEAHENPAFQTLLVNAVKWVASH